jgi:ADP-heptose:LPS heptosyltransferase
MDLVRKLGVVTDNYQPEVFVSDEEAKTANETLSRLGAGQELKRVILHTGSRGSAPNWGEERYVELLRGIFDTFNTTNVRFLLTAVEMTPEFINTAKQIGGDRIIILSDKLPTLRDLIATISLVDLVICSSTGPIHLADSLNRHCIGLHCHRPMSCAKHWGVINKKSVNLEATAEACQQHCSADQNNCGIHNALPVADVIDALKQFLQNK